MVLLAKLLPFDLHAFADHELFRLKFGGEKAREGDVFLRWRLVQRHRSRLPYRSTESFVDPRLPMVSVHFHQIQTLVGQQVNVELFADVLYERASLRWTVLPLPPHL